MKNIAVENCEVNFLLFKGYSYNGLATENSFLIEFDNLTIKNNFISV